MTLLASPDRELYLTAAIVSEAFTLLRRRFGYALALDWARTARSSSRFTVHHIDEAFDREVWAVIERYAGVPLSYADASLVVLGDRLGIATTFAFDGDFRQAGLQVVP